MRSTQTRRPVLLALILLSSACNDDPDVDSALSRMMQQPKGETYGPSAIFADGRAMRPLPDGVVAQEHALPTADIQAPPVTLEMLNRGRDRFNIACAVCHGILGDGDSVVAHNMELRAPPSLHEPRIVAFSDAQIHQVIDEGYGLMPSYRQHLSLADRWAVVAYVKALQLSQRITIVALPADLQEEANKSLKSR